MLEVIQSLCKDQGISVFKLEKELGFGNGTIYKWEKSSPSIEKVQKVADYLKVSVDRILYGFELTRFEELLRIIMNKRTCEQFAKDTGIDLDVIEDYAFGKTTEQPSIDTVLKIATHNEREGVVDAEFLFKAAGYDLEELSGDLLENIPLELLHYYQEQGMSGAEMAVSYARFRDAEYNDAMNDPERDEYFNKQKGTEEESDLPETIAAHHDGEDWTEEELEDIEEFKELLKLKRQLKKNRE